MSSANATPTRALSKTLSDLVDLATKAFARPALVSASPAVAKSLRDELAKTQTAIMPQQDVAIPALLCAALYEFLQFGNPGTAQGGRLQSVIGVLLPMVRADLGVAIEYERQARS